MQGGDCYKTSVEKLLIVLCFLQEGLRAQQSKAKALALKKEEEEKQLKESMQNQDIGSVKYLYQLQHLDELKRKREWVFTSFLLSSASTFPLLFPLLSSLLLFSPFPILSLLSPFSLSFSPLLFTSFFSSPLPSLPLLPFPSLSSPVLPSCLLSTLLLTSLLSLPTCLSSTPTRFSRVWVFSLTVRWSVYDPISV